jgi:hypothetical protein
MFATCKRAKFVAGVSSWAFAACVATFTLTGCERKERVLDVQTPAGDVQVDRNIDTGEVEVDVHEE